MQIYKRKSGPELYARIIGLCGPGVFLCWCSDGFKRHLSKDVLEELFEPVDICLEIR